MLQMKFSIILVVCLLGLATAACEGIPPTSGNAGPGSFTGDLNHLGEPALNAGQN